MTANGRCLSVEMQFRGHSGYELPERQIGDPELTGVGACRHALLLGSNSDPGCYAVGTASEPGALCS